MPETPAASVRLSCPRCHETILPEDKYCFHCGRRLQPSAATAPAEPSPRPRTRFPQWPLAVIGAAAVVFAVYEVHHQSHVIAVLQSRGQSRIPRTHDAKLRRLHPVVTTTTTYPANLPSSASWTPEVETYQNVQFGLRVPVGMNTPLQTSATSNRWVWGQPQTPDQVVLAVVSGKPADASVPLGANTYGTAIRRTGSVASQSLYIRWSSRQWVAVSMTVPASHIGWLGAIATSVRVS